MSELSYHQLNQLYQQRSFSALFSTDSRPRLRNCWQKSKQVLEQIFNSRVIIDKHLQHQRDLFRNFTDFKKAFDRVWHAGMWQVLRIFNIEKGLAQTIRALHENSIRAVLLNSQLEVFFKITVGVRQRRLLSSIPFNLFLEKTMQETLHDHHTSIFIGGRSICNLRFADDIDVMGGSNGELQDLTNTVVDRATAYGMEGSTEKSKIMSNSTNKINADVSMNCQKLEEMTSFKYLGATLCKDGTCSAEIRIRIASATAAMARLNKIWRCNTITFTSKFKIYKSLVTAIFLYCCETWTLLADSERNYPGFRTKCPRKRLCISYLEHKTSDWVRSKSNFIVGPQETLLTTAKGRKFAWFGHDTRHDSLSKIILQGTLEGGRRRGRQRHCWMDNIKEWTSLPMPELLTGACCRKDWKRTSAESSFVFPPDDPIRQGTEMN